MFDYEIIKKAIDVETEYSYIDIRGKKMCFSKFILNELYKVYKKNEDGKTKIQIEAFEYYPQASLGDRRKTVKNFIKYLKEFKNEKIINDEYNFKNIKHTDIKFLKGVGPKIAYYYYKLGINTINDLITFYPKKYIDYTLFRTISELNEGEYCTIKGTVTSFSMFTSKKNLAIVKIILKDETGTIILNYFFKQNNKYLSNKYRDEFKKGSTFIISGKVKFDKYNGKYTFDNPKTEQYIVSYNNETKGQISPVYPLCENFSEITLKKGIENAINIYQSQIQTIIPEYLTKKYNFLSRYEAIKEIHNPTNLYTLEVARNTLVYEELFLFELKIAKYRNDIKNNYNLKFNMKENSLVNKFIKSLPFELTKAQKNAINEILNDLNSQKPMRRLLEGDVGSGKTVVACIMMLAAIENGYQTAIMAPTEILARQHYNNFIKWLLPMGISVNLLLGSTSQKIKKEIKQGLLNGQTQVVIGTHALIQNDVEFYNLGACVIDEQHRFGVNQRSKLSNKGNAIHLLSMTATPIPRSLALTFNGDLDITIIDERPKGRKSIITSLLTQNERKKAYKLIKDEIKKKHQAYIVYPLIDESETIYAQAAQSAAIELQEGEFKDYKVGLLHGKLNNDEKEKVMKDFKEGLYDILVSTTVVEVGVDVSNATVIMIENAERFGLAQLHQLRGRVGRNDKQSYCLLISNSNNEDTIERLNILTQTNDGFIIAQKDLELRGPGEYIGTKQSGIQNFKIADIIKDIRQLENAKNDAFDFIKNYKLDDYPLLKIELKDDNSMLKAN